MAERGPFDTRLALPSEDPLTFVDLPGDPPKVGAAVRIGIDRGGELPAVDPNAFDALVTTRPDAERPWVSVEPRRLEPALAAVERSVRGAPIAAAMLARVLRLGEHVAFVEALEIESLAYSALLGGSEFACWLAARGPMRDIQTGAHPVRYERDGDRVHLTLDSPRNRNAMTAAMRDALCEALVNLLDDLTVPEVVLTGAGRCFSTGGHLPEFGTVGDLALAHMVRTQRSAARLLDALGARASVRLHGACIGSGIEIGAAAARRIGTPDFLMQLPELGMGLIPGAGGTVTLPRAIGRHRTAWLALGGFRVDADAALRLGLLHAIEP